jgi:hypothetical protein
VRYTNPRLLPISEHQEYRTHCMIQGGIAIPFVKYMPVEFHSEHAYPGWLWPGCLIGLLFDLSDALAAEFDWPVSGHGQLGTHLGAWFVFTGEASSVRPLDVRWERKRSTIAWGALCSSCAATQIF